MDLKSNPAPLGLMGFGMTTVLLNLHNSGLFSLGTMILAMGIFYGGFAQIFAGIMEYRNGNTFGTTAFCSFGLFWLSLVFLLVFPVLGWGSAPEPMAMASYFVMWGLFTLFMFFGSLKLNRMLQFVLLSLTILFFMLAIGDITGNALFKIITGYEGIICGLSACYGAMAIVLNEVYGRTVLPICPVKSKKSS
ncbi:MAG: acetate uptake transporter [Candidatus Aenigmarchaeota archaeon]|nr:acetate uptake transporter [Candidatus Aenigmarchaeota archaeon]